MISSNILMFDYMVFFLFVCLFFQQKFLYIQSPPLPIWSSSSELSEQLSPGLLSSVLSQVLKYNNSTTFRLYTFLQSSFLKPASLTSSQNPAWSRLGFPSSCLTLGFHATWAFFQFLKTASFAYSWICKDGAPHLQSRIGEWMWASRALDNGRS